MSISEKLLLSPDPIFQVSEAAHRLLERTEGLSDNVAFLTAMIEHRKRGFRLLGFHSDFTAKRWKLDKEERKRLDQIISLLNETSEDDLKRDWPELDDDSFQTCLRTPLTSLQEEARLDETRLALLLRFLSRKTRPVDSYADGVVRKYCLHEERVRVPTAILVDPTSDEPAPPLKLSALDDSSSLDEREQISYESNVWADDLVRLFCKVRSDPEVCVVVVPIFDGVRVGFSSGRFLGNLHLIFPNKSLRKKFLKKTLSTVTDWPLIAGGHIASAYRRSQIATIDASKVSEEDYSDDYPALRHYLRQALNTADWKKILVFDSSDSPKQCWRRASDDRWINCADVETCTGCPGGDTPLVVSGELIEILPRELLTSVEGSKLNLLSIRFYYPKDIRLPNEDSERRVLERFYRREILELWQVLFPKVMLGQRILRKSLRSMISGLLARSMAHDVGSHTLANAEERIKELEENDAVNSLLHYVRERMIWVGEVATMPSHFLGVVSLKEGLLKPYFGKKEHRRNMPVGLLLEDEMGSNGASLGKPEVYGIVPLIGLPNGSLGAQGFYVILDNILRNAAKYGAGKSNPSNTLTLHIRVDEDCSLDKDHVCGDPELVRLRIWDSWSNADPNDEESKARWARLNSYCASRATRPEQDEIRDETVIADLDLSRKEKGRWQFIDLEKEGDPIHLGGGIKEMRVAACWLRDQNLAQMLLPWEVAKPPLLRPILIQDTYGEKIAAKWSELKEEAKIGFELYILRARLCVVIDPDLKRELDESRWNDLLRKGILIATNIEEALERGWGKAGFAIVAAEYDAVPRNRWHLPPRLLTVAKVELTENCSVVELGAEVYASMKEAIMNGQVQVLWSCLGVWLAKHSRSRARHVYLFLRKKLRETMESCIEPDKPHALSDRVNLLLAGAKCRKLESKGSQVVAYVDHGTYGHTIDKLCTQGRLDACWKSRKGSFERIEHGLRSSGQTAQFLRMIGSVHEDYRDFFLWHLVEAMAIDVHVFDDRLNDSKGNYPERLGVTIHRESELQDYNVERADGVALMIVAHFAALEKTSLNPQKWVDQQLENGALLVGLSSDRGEAIRRELPTNATFVSSAVVHRCLAEESKLGLVQVLLSSRAVENRSNE